MASRLIFPPNGIPLTDFLKRTAPVQKPLLFLTAFAFLLVSLNPTFYADDSAETIAAAVLLGLPHPPGYPLYTLLSHLFAALPLGGYGFRVNLLSALLAALNVSLLFILFKKWVGLRDAWAIPLSLFWVAGATAYTGALSAKTGIYELTACFILAVLLALLQKRWELAGFLFGLSFSNHWMTFLVLAPGLLFFAFDPVRRGTALEFFRGLAGFILGLSLYLFLPLRGNQGPLLNWGDPVTFSSFWFDLTRAQYQKAEANGTWAAWGPQALFLLKNYFWEWPGLLLAALAGIFWTWRDKSLAVSGLLGGWFLLMVTLSFYLNLDSDRFYLLSAYALPSQTFLLIFAGFALTRAPDWEGWKRFAAAGLIFILAGLGGWRFSQDRQTHYTYAYDYTLNTFAQLPRNTLFYARGDSLIFPAWYFQWVEKRRPDLALVGVDGLPMDWIRTTLAHTHPDLHVPQTDQKMGAESVPTLMKWMAQKNADRPFFISFDKIDPQIIPGDSLRIEGLVQRVSPDAQKHPVPDLSAFDQEVIWNRMRLRHWKDGEPVDDRTAIFFANNYAADRNLLGLLAEDDGDAWMAKTKGKSAGANFLTAQEAYGLALYDYNAAFEWYPKESRYAYNVGNALVHLGRYQEALDYYEKAWVLDPHYAEAYFNAAIAAFHLGQNRRAGDYFNETLRLNPDYPNARQNLDYLIKNGWYHS